jgi:hypothetical protein
MSAPKQGDSPAPGQNGVLSNLPRTRPQRASARRVAERKTTAARIATAEKAESASRRAGPNGGPPASSTARPARRTPKPPKGKARVSVEPVPRQGFECEDRASGAVHPPGGGELIASAAELVGELAKAGFATGERVLKDVFSLLPLS